MPRLHHAKLALPCRDDAAAQAVASSLQPELAAGPEGTTSSAVSEGAVLHGAIAADDLSSLRAALTGFVRLAQAAHDVAVLE